MRKYTETHEWIAISGNEGTIGITDFAQNQLGDIVFVDFPAPGKKIRKGESLGLIESVKASSEFYSPVSGTVKSVNSKVSEQPELVNQSPMEDGWLVKLELASTSELSSLLDEAAYEKKASEGGH